MTPTRRRLIGTAVTAAAFPLRRARGQAQPVRIGVLNDQSGPWRDLSGPTSVACARQAVAEFAAQGLDVEVVSADHRNDPAQAATIVRGWIDQDGVDLVLDGGDTACALALARICQEANKVLIATSAVAGDLTGADCRATTIHWVFDATMQARSTGTGVARTGGNAWFLLVADDADGAALARETTRAVADAGGTVLGTQRFAAGAPTGLADLLRQPQAAKAKVLGICAAGVAAMEGLQQARAADPAQTMTLAPLLLFGTQVHRLGLETTQGARLTEAFYWNLNSRTRSFTARVSSKVSLWPNMIQAGAYSATLHYLKAVHDLGAAAAKADGAATVARMKAMPTDDDCFGSGSIRADGRKLHPAVLFEVKRPDESQHEWDLLKPLAVTPADAAFRPLSDGGCPLVKA